MIRFAIIIVSISLVTDKMATLQVIGPEAENVQKIHLNSTINNRRIFKRQLSIKPDTDSPHSETINPDDDGQTDQPFIDITIPTPTDLKQCYNEWSEYFSQKKSDIQNLRCCASRKNCECRLKLCKESNFKLPGCPPNDGPGNCLTSCEPPHDPSIEECMKYETMPRSLTTSGFNWWWILVLVAILMIILICVTIFCVYRKKFTKKDSRKDSQRAKVTFGPMNVKSKVQWHGKHRKKHSGRHRSNSRRDSRGSMAAGRGTSRGQSAGASNNRTHVKSTRVSRSTMMKAVS